MGSRVLGLVGSGSGGVEQLLPRLIRPAQDAGWTVVVTLTPTAGRWLREAGMLTEIEKASGFPVRVDPRSPAERSPHPSVDCYLLAPASANTVAKLARGIADNQALTQVHEAIGIPDLPVFTAMTCGRSTSHAAHRDVNCPGQPFSTR